MTSRSIHRRYSQIGLDRLVRLDWLKKTAAFILAGNEPLVVKSLLQDELSSSFRSPDTTVRGSLDKTITILLKIWGNVPKDLIPLRDKGLDLISQLPNGKLVAVHWGMTMAVYPFWGSVATQVGRLLKLQGIASASQVQRRLKEQYGERETVSRRVRYVLRSFVDWMVLKETSVKGTYSQGSISPLDDLTLAAWMVEVSLRSESKGSGSIKDLLDSPKFFPYRLPHMSIGQLASISPRLDVIRHGLDDDIVMLHE